MNIGKAVEAMRMGEYVCREGWNGKHMFLFLCGPQGKTQEYVMMKTAQDTYVPWLCSQSDLLANDWEVVEE